DRVDARGVQRGGRRARAVRRKNHQHATHSGKGVARHPGSEELIMFAAAFDYHRPKTVQEALKLLKEVKGSRILAGGHSLIPAMKLRLSSPSALIDISRIAELRGIKSSKDGLVIGAMTTHAEIASSDVVRKV